jgi:hypothetical protein
MNEKCCENCKFSLPAKNGNCVGCKLLNGLTENKVPLDMNEVFGNVYEGWFGEGLIINGLVVSKSSICDYFEAKL